MKFRCLILIGLTLVGCGSTTSTGAKREVDDHPDAFSGGSGGSVAAGGATGGGTADARAPEADAGLCGGAGAVINVRMSRAPTKPLPVGAGGTPARVDGGRLPGLPSDPCVSYAPPDCPGGPRPIFGCPIVYGPDRNPIVHPGDALTVSLALSDDGLAAYSCAGIGTDSPLTRAASLFDAVSPASVQVTGQVPPSTLRGTVMHFTAIASGTKYSAAQAAACSNDLTQVDFDVIVE